MDYLYEHFPKQDKGIIDAEVVKNKLTTLHIVFVRYATFACSLHLQLSCSHLCTVHMFCCNKTPILVLCTLYRNEVLNLDKHKSYYKQPCELLKRSCELFLHHSCGRAHDIKERARWWSRLKCCRILWSH